MRRIRYILLPMLALSFPVYSADSDSGLNHETIHTIEENAFGIFNEGTGTTLFNKGFIITQGAGARGIFNNGGANVQIINEGSLLTAGDRGHAIYACGKEGMIVNSGSIETSGSFAVGIYSIGVESSLRELGMDLHQGDGTTTVTNNGKVLTRGESSHAIFSEGAHTVISNNGRLFALGDKAIGIVAAGPDTHIINSGSVHSSTTHAIRFDEGNSTLTLLRGSTIQGSVFTNKPLNMNVESGLNLYLSLDAGGDTFHNLGINAPFVRLGQTLAVVDPTGFALQADVAADLSDTVLDGIYRHRLSCCEPCGCEFWVQGIGSYRKRGHDSETVGYDNWQGGFLLGYDLPICSGDGGFFAGASFGAAEVAQHTQKANFISYLAGISYSRTFCNSSAGLAVVLGYVDWDNDRYVANNLVPSGVEKASAEITGAFISPELTLAHRFSELWCRPIMSLTLRYAGLFLGNYHEKGSSSNLAVKEREIDLLTSRFEIALPYSAITRYYCWSVEPYFGAFGRYQTGGREVQGILLGQPIDFDQEGPTALGAFLLGFRGIQSFDCFNLFLNLEWSFDNYKSSRVLGEGGVCWSF